MLIAAGNQPQAEFRKLFAKQPKHTRQPGRRELILDAELQGALHGWANQGLPGILVDGQDGARIDEHRLPIRREADPACRAPDKLAVHPLLKPRDALADRRLGAPEIRGCHTETAPGGNSFKRSKFIRIDQHIDSPVIAPTIDARM